MVNSNSSNTFVCLAQCVLAGHSAQTPGLSAACSTGAPGLPALPSLPLRHGHCTWHIIRTRTGQISTGGEQCASPHPQRLLVPGTPVNTHQHFRTAQKQFTLRALQNKLVSIISNRADSLARHAMAFV